MSLVLLFQGTPGTPIIPQTWTKLSDSAITYTKVSDNSQTWSPIADANQVWTKL